MTPPQPTTTEELRPVDEVDRWWQRHVTPLLARWERDFGQQRPAPPAPVAATPGRQVEAETAEGRAA